MITTPIYDPDTQERLANRNYVVNNQNGVSAALPAVNVTQLDTTTTSGNTTEVTPPTEPSPTTLKQENVGTESTSGNVIINADQKPNLFLNFREKTEPRANLLFRFKTGSSFGTAGTAGVAGSTWSSDTNISNITLTANSGTPLKIISAYGDKFYELVDDNSYIENASVKLNFNTFPNYTILVFAVGNTSGATTSLFPLYSNLTKIHQFGKGLTNDSYNLGYVQAISGKSSTVSKPIYSFAGSIMNRSDIIPYESLARISTISSVTSLNVFDNINGKSSFQSEYDFVKRNPLDYFNLYNLGTNLSTPDSSTKFVINDGGVSDINLETFYLFFVEIFTYNSGTTSINGNPFVTVENRINGITTMTANYTINKEIDISDFAYKIKLSKILSGATHGYKLFLLDYLSGQEDTAEKMKNKSWEYIEYLTYQRRNLLLKSSGDLQISNSTNNLKFKIPLTHPFLNIMSY